MNTPCQLGRIDALVESAARALFGAHGLELGPIGGGADEVPDDHDVASTIGFSAPELHGAILMTTRKDIVAQASLRALRGREPSEREVCDWAGELVNQLLGRVKNALVPFGLTLNQGTPTVVTGQHVHRAPPSTTVARSYCFEAAGGSLVVYFDAALSDGFVLREVGDPSLRSAAEGDVHLF